MTPAPPSRPSRRAQPAERNVRLDPQGIYGTRSARRQSHLRRRRQWQNSLLWGLGLLGLAVAARVAMAPRQLARDAGQLWQLPFRPAGETLVAPDGALLFASQSGGLWRAKFDARNQLQMPVRLWSQGFAPAATPLLSQKQVFWPGSDGTLFALDAGSGKPLWRASFPGSLVAQPAFAQVDGEPMVFAGDDAGNIAAYSAGSGARRWHRDLGAALGDGIGILSAQNGRGVGVLVPLLSGPASRGGLTCLDAGSGAIRWNFPGETRGQSAGVAPPVGLGNRVFWCNDEGAIVCLDGATGRKIWKSFAAPMGFESQSLAMLRTAPLIVASEAVVVVGAGDGTWRAFDLQSGTPKWSQNLGGAARFAAQSLRFEGKNALLVTGETPAIALLDARTGAVLRRWTTLFPGSNGLVQSGKNAGALDAQGHLQTALLQ